MEIRQGVWSEVGLFRVLTEVAGNMVVQEFEVKNQSSLSKRGGVAYWSK